MEKEASSRMLDRKIKAKNAGYDFDKTSAITCT